MNNILKNKVFSVSLVLIVLLIGIFFISKETGLVNTDASCRYTLTTIYNSVDSSTECVNGLWGEWADTGIENEQKRTYDGLTIVKSYKHERSEIRTTRGLATLVGCLGIGDQTRTVNAPAAYGASLTSTTITPFACSFEQTKTTVGTIDDGGGYSGYGTIGDGGSSGGSGNGDSDTMRQIITTGAIVTNLGEVVGESETVTGERISGEISDIECSTDKTYWKICDTVIKIANWDDKIYVRYKTSNQCTINNLNWIVNSGSNVGTYGYPMNVEVIDTKNILDVDISNLLELKLTQEPEGEALGQIFLENLSGKFTLPCSGSDSRDLRIKVINILSSEI